MKDVRTACAFLRLGGMKHAITWQMMMVIILLIARIRTVGKRGIAANSVKTSATGKVDAGRPHMTYVLVIVKNAGIVEKMRNVETYANQPVGHVMTRRK